MGSLLRSLGLTMESLASSSEQSVCALTREDDAIFYFYKYLQYGYI
jgi:hypothetical protein